MDTTIIHLTRHGEVDNPEGILYARLPHFHLSPLGHQMARAVANNFQAISADITTVLSSPLERAIETATPTAEAYGLDIITDERLIEAANSFEGIAVHANRSQILHPRYWNRFTHPLRPSWGEPYHEQAYRMVGALKRALHLARGHAAMVVSHQLPIWCLRSFVEGRHFAHLPSQRECSLASVTSFTFVNNTLVGMSYDEPAADLVAKAKDVTPGRSQAITNAGR